MNATPHLWAHVQARIDDTGVSEAMIAKRAGMPPQTLNSWKQRGLSRLPRVEAIRALSRELRIDYETFLLAILRDMGYLPDGEVSVDELRSARNKLVHGVPPVPADVAASDPGQPSQHEQATQAQDEAYDIDQSERE